MESSEIQNQFEVKIMILQLGHHISEVVLPGFQVPNQLVVKLLFFKAKLSISLILHGNFDFAFE